MKAFSIIPYDGDFLLYSKPKTARVIYKNKSYCILTQSWLEDGLNWLEEKLESKNMQRIEKDALVTHLYYELGHLYNKTKNISETSKLAIAIEYEGCKKLKQKDLSKSIQLESVESISRKDYVDKFQKVQNHLNQGDCYQVNLTSRHLFKHREKLSSWLDLFLSTKSQLGAYAHFTYLAGLDEIILSNSPECLFQINSQHIYSMPIKGTLSDTSGAKNRLFKSKKDEGELYMITDLLRNDLTRIELTPSRVISKKKLLKVPGLVHQYSIVSAKFSKNLNLLKILKALFPGGSVTGAPKKRVMQIIDELEDSDRSLYCGSTVIWHRSLKAASINIRTALIKLDAGELYYGSGGGVTLLSKTNDEYEEMLSKVKSFLLFLNK